MEQNVKTKWFVMTGFALLGIAFLSKWQFIFGESVIDRMLRNMSVPVWSNGDIGLHYTAIVSFILLITGLMMLAKRYSGRMIFVFLLVFILLPTDLFANVYQSNFAKGIYTLEFNEENSNCEYETNDDGILTGKCTLSFENHGKKPLSFQVSLDQNFDDVDLKVFEMIDLDDRQFKLDTRERRDFEVTFQKSLESEEYQSAGGSINVFDVTVIGEKRVREL